MLFCAQPCQCVLPQPVANPHSRNAAPNQPTFAQRWQWRLDRANPGLLRTLQFLLAIFMWNQARSLVRICRPHLPKVPRAPSLFEHFEALLQFCALFVGNFPRLRPATAETETLLRRPQEPHYLKKRRVSRPRVFSPVNLHASLHFPTTL